MRRIKKVTATVAILAAMLIGTTTAFGGIIVNFEDTNTGSKCEVAELKSIPGADFGVIVNLTGVIVNFTGVIVNFTGVIVNFADTKDSTCGHLPTSD